VVTILTVCALQTKPGKLAWLTTSTERTTPVSARAEQREVHVDPGRDGDETIVGVRLPDGRYVQAFIFAKCPDALHVLIDERPRKSRRSDEWPPRKRGKS
jgi:hypothetical protein